MGYYEKVETGYRCDLCGSPGYGGTKESPPDGWHPVKIFMGSLEEPRVTHDAWCLDCCGRLSTFLQTKGRKVETR